MKKHINLWLVIFLALSLALPIYSMAGNLLNIFTTDGYYVGIPYKSLFVDEAGNVTAMTNGTRADLGTDLSEPVITISNFSGSGVTGDNSTGIVTGTKSIPLTFHVVATDSAGIQSLRCLFPSDTFTLNEGSQGEGTFQKTYDTAGPYYATFEASATENSKTYYTQRMIKINIIDPQVQQYTLTVSANPANGGTVSPQSGTYASGSQVTVTATANSGYTFGSWSGTAAGDTISANTATIRMNDIRSITANFTQNATQQYTLTVSVNPAGGGTVSPQSGTYASGSQVTVTATPNSGYTFGSWSGTAAGDTISANTATIRMNDIRSITANFSGQPLSPSPTPSGENLPVGYYPVMYLNRGEQKVYIVNVNSQLMYLKFVIAGLDGDTQATFSWTFPDGTVYPQASIQGKVNIQGNDSGGLLVLRSLKYWGGSNIPYDYIPQGNHIIRINGISALSYLKVGIQDAY